MEVLSPAPGTAAGHGCLAHTRGAQDGRKRPALVQPRAMLLQDFGDYQDGYYSVQTTEGEQIAQLIAGYIDIILKKASAWVCGEPACSRLLSSGCCKVPLGHAVLLEGLGMCRGVLGVSKPGQRWGGWGGARRLTCFLFTSTEKEQGPLWTGG